MTDDEPGDAGDLGFRWRRFKGGDVEITQERPRSDVLRGDAAVRFVAAVAAGDPQRVYGPCHRQLPARQRAAGSVDPGRDGLPRFAGDEVGLDGAALDVDVGQDPVEPAGAATSCGRRAAPWWPAPAACGRWWRRAARRLARPTPNSLMMRSGSRRKLPNTTTMIARRGRDDPGGGGQAVGHRRPAVAGAVATPPSPARAGRPRSPSTARTRWRTASSARTARSGAGSMPRTAPAQPHWKIAATTTRRRRRSTAGSSPRP